MAKKIRDENKEMLRNKAKQNAKRFISRNKIDERYDSSVADLFKKMYVTIYLSLYHQQLTDHNTKTKQALIEANKTIAALKNTKTICPCGDWDDDFHTCRAYQNDDEWQKDIEERDYYKKHYVKALKFLNIALDKAEGFCDRNRPGLFMDVFGKEAQWAKSHERNLGKELTTEDFIACHNMKIMGSESFRVEHHEPIIQELPEDMKISKEDYKSWEEMTPFEKAIFHLIGGFMSNCYYDTRRTLGDNPVTPIIRQVDSIQDRQPNDRITYFVGLKDVKVWFFDKDRKLKEKILSNDEITACINARIKERYGDGVRS